MTARRSGWSGSRWGGILVPRALVSRAVGFTLAVGLAFAAAWTVGGCEAVGEMFVECAEDGSCEGERQCYGSDDIVGYCSATCYGSIECPRDALCYEGICMLICEDGGEPCPGGTTCNLLEPPRGLCQP